MESSEHPEPRRPSLDADGQDGEVTLHGLPASGGIAIGPAWVFERERVFVHERELDPEEVGHEIELLHQAIARVDEDISKIVQFAHEKLEPDAAEIFDTQLLLLHDVELIRSLEQRIRRERRNADFLINDELEKFASLLITTGDPVFRDRVSDLEDVGQRLLRSLLHERVETSVEGAHIVVAENLTPSDTLLFSTRDVLGFASDFGGLTSHAAILARSLSIPAVVGLHTATATIRGGDLLVIDGQRGVLVVRPSEATQRDYQSRIARITELEGRLRELVRLPTVTTDGRRVELSANAEFVNELDFLIAQGAQGIGLYRTEHLYMTKGDFPSEQEQYLAYSEIAHMMYPKPVTFRTFDLGGDKFLEGERTEANPFLGWRGIRVLLDKPDVFHQQLRAILRASVMKNTRIMFPMVSGVLELRQALRHLDEARAELREARIPFNEAMKVGVMIEVPSSVLVADELARLVDFFSIGTNDLIQYLLAVDRNNDLISDLYQEFHPAVLRAIRMVIDTGHRHGITVGMCGEMAGNPVAAVLLLGMGLDEFSMAPSVILEVKDIIRATSHADAAALAKRVFGMQTTVDIKNFLREYIAEHHPMLLPMIKNDTA